MYQIIVSKKVRKMIDKLPLVMKSRIEEKIESLAFNPMPHGCVKLSGFENTYRVRVGDYRIIYTRNDETITVIIEKVSGRKDAY
jgi:mRNA interferase RelE/StbE